jgi:hypothetical protein
MYILSTVSCKTDDRPPYFAEKIIFLANLLAPLFTEIVIFHGLVIYAYFQFKENFTPLYDPNKQTLIEKFGANKFARNIIFSAKYGGLSSVLQDTVERIYITYPKGNKNISLSSCKLISSKFLYQCLLIWII